MLHYRFNAKPKGNSSSVKEITYPKKAFIPLTFGVSFAVLIYVEKVVFSVDLFNPYFYIALLCCMGITAILIFMVYRVTLRLDATCNWRDHQNLRMMRQVINGVLWPLAIAFALMYCYFYFFGIPIFETIWFRKYLPLNSLLLLLINLFFAFYWLMVIEPAMQISNTDKVGLPKQLVSEHLANFTVASEPIVSSDVQSLNSKLDNLIEPLWPIIACVFCCEKHYFLINFTGEVSIWKYNISQSIKRLPADQFVQLNRSYLVNLNAIDYQTTKGSKVTLVQLIPAVEASIIKIRSIQNDKAKQLKNATLIRQAKPQKINKKQSPLFFIKVSYERKAQFFAALKKFRAIHSAVVNTVANSNMVGN